MWLDCTEVHTEGGCTHIASLVESPDEEISLSAATLLSNLCIINRKLNLFLYKYHHTNLILNR